MNCQETRELIEDALDKRLAGGVRRKFDLHLMHCRECRRFYEAEQAEHSRWFRAMNSAAETPHPLPPDFADRLVAAVMANGAAHTPFFRRFRLPRWFKVAASLMALASFVSFAAVIIVEKATEADDLAAQEGTDATEGTDETDATLSTSSADYSVVPYVPAVPSVFSDPSTPSSDTQLKTNKGEAEMNIRKKATVAIAAATLAATSASATELPWTGGDATLGDGKVVVLCDENGSVTNIVAKPTGGEELRITGSAMTFVDGAKVSLASPASGIYADGSLVFANDVTAQGALTLNRNDGAFPIWSGNRLVGVNYVNAFAANGTAAADWNIHSAYAVPTDGAASVSSNECPHGIYRPIPTNGKTCNRWSGKHTFSARFQLQLTTSGYIQVRMLTGMRTTAGLYLPTTDTWSDSKYRRGTESDARWFWPNSTPVENVTVQYGGDEYDFGICRIIFQHKNATMGTIGFAGEVTMAGAVAVGQGVKMAVMPKADSTFAAPQFSGYGDVEYARNSTLSYTNAMVHSTITVTNATVTLNTLGAIPNYSTLVVDKGGLLDVSKASGSPMAEGAGKTFPTDIEIRKGGKVFSDKSAGATWKFGRKVPFKLLGGTLECNSSGGSVNYVYLSRLLAMDGATLKCNKPFWVANDYDGYWTIGGTGATVDGPVEFLSASSSAVRGAVVNVNDGATLTFANTLAYNSGFPHVDFIKAGGGTVVCQSTCQPTAIANGMTVQDGVWKLGISNSWLNARPLILDGGTVAGAPNTANTVGALTVGANGGTIELDPGATLAFADSSGKTWAGSLTIKGWCEGSVKFGDSSSALTKDQLDQVRAKTETGRELRLCLNSAGYLARYGMRIVVR